MKREFLKQLIPGITDEQLNAVMNENGNDLNAMRATITQHETTIQTLTTERDGYKTQLSDRNKDIKALQEQAKGNEDLTKQLGELQTKYDTDTKALQKKLDDQAADHAIEAVFSGVQFASSLAKRAAIADFKAKGYKLGSDGKYAEADGYIAQLKKDDPAAFKTESTNDGKSGDKTDSTPKNNPQLPRFSTPMSNGGGADSKGSAFDLSFNYVRSRPKE